MGETHKGLRASVASADALGEDCHITTTSADLRALLADHDEHRRIAAYLDDVLQAYRERLAEREAEVERLRETLQSVADICDEDHAARDCAPRLVEIRGIARAALNQQEQL